jgi:hypothetical protein
MEKALNRLVLIPDFYSYTVSSKGSSDKGSAVKATLGVFRRERYVEKRPPLKRPLDVFVLDDFDAVGLRDAECGDGHP